jgi:hypothetical protein
MRRHIICDMIVFVISSVHRQIEVQAVGNICGEFVFLSLEAHNPSPMPSFSSVNQPRCKGNVFLRECQHHLVPSVQHFRECCVIAPGSNCFSSDNAGRRPTAGSARGSSESRGIGSPAMESCDSFVILNRSVTSSGATGIGTGRRSSADTTIASLIIKSGTIRATGRTVGWA